MVLAIIYSLVTPPFEAGDESRHYAVVKYMADTGHLINQNDPKIRDIQHHWSHEGNQPPLYYALAAALTFWIDTGSWDDVFWYNPHTTIGNPLRLDNKNITIHPPGESWPWRNHVLAVHLIRFLSIAMATVTVATCYAIALSLFKGNRWLAVGAMAITAFNPMFIFISASINNDNGVIMFITLALWLMIRMAERGIDTSPLLPRSSAPPLRSVALLGLLIGLGALSKLYAFGLLPIAGLLFIWLAYQDNKIGVEASAGPKQDLPAEASTPVANSDYQKEASHISYPTSHIPLRFWRNVLIWSTVLALVFVAVVGWFYVRNMLLYNGDVLALQIMRDTAGQRQEVPSLATIRAEFEGFRIAYWALFGGVNILADTWIYTILDWVSLAAVIGVTTFLILDFRFWIYDLNPKSRRFPSKNKIATSTFIILLGWYLVMIAGFIAWNLTQPAGQGRLLYPAIAAISALGMLGLSWWLPDLGQKIVAGCCILGLFLFAVLAPVLYIAPAYAKPPILTQTDLPTDIQPVDLIYDDAVQLIGYKLHTDTVRPAESLPITLYWKILQPVNLNYSIFIHLLGRQRQVIGQVDSYPGGGKWPTTLLSPGDILADHYEVPIPPEAELSQAPTRLQVAAGLYNYFEPGRPGRPAFNMAGERIEPIIATAKLVPWQWPEPPQDAAINFFDKATLLSYHLADNQQSVTLNWQANSDFDTDYTVFIQAWPINGGEYAAGFDGPPVQGDYPTSLWSPNEIIIDTHPLDLTMLASGTYNLLVGLYNPTTGERLPPFDSNGPLPDYAVNLGMLKVKE